MDKLTLLEEEIITILTDDEIPRGLIEYTARNIFSLSKIAEDETEVRKALNAMVSRGDIVRGKGKLYSLPEEKAPDVVKESSENKKGGGEVLTDKEATNIVDAEWPDADWPAVTPAQESIEDEQVFVAPKVEEEKTRHEKMLELFCENMAVAQEAIDSYTHMVGDYKILAALTRQRDAARDAYDAYCLSDHGR